MWLYNDRRLSDCGDKNPWYSEEFCSPQGDPWHQDDAAVATFATERRAALVSTSCHTCTKFSLAFSGTHNFFHVLWTFSSLLSFVYSAALAKCTYPDCCDWKLELEICVLEDRRILFTNFAFIDFLLETCFYTSARWLEARISTKTWEMGPCLELFILLVMRYVCDTDQSSIC